MQAAKMTSFKFLALLSIIAVSRLSVGDGSLFESHKHEGSGYQAREVVNKSPVSSH